MLINVTFHFIAFSILTFSTHAMSAQVSQAQIEQFKKLPKAQQEMLANSMGIDLSDIKAQLSGKNSDSNVAENTQRYPRGTEFDLEGNPVQYTEEQYPDEQEENVEGVKKLKPFGYDVFANSPQTFAPTMDCLLYTSDAADE